MIANWSDLNVLRSPRGILPLNASSGDRYLTLNARCDSGADLRVTFDNIPQADGQLNHRQYLTGYKMRLALALWVGSEPACGEDATRMLDALGYQLDGLRNPDTSVGPARIVWTPTGYASRMVNEIVLMEKPVVTVEPGGAEGIVTVTFGVVSAFPYEMSESEQTPATLVGGTGLGDTLTNTGTTQFWPVFRVHGPTHEFWLYNLTTGKALHYDASMPGGSIIGTSEYVEIDMFSGTVVLNGNVDDDFIAGIDFENTEFWTLVPGGNDVAVVGAASTTVLWNDAWL